MVKMTDYNTCPACQTENRADEKYCLNCGQKLIDEKENEIILKDKLPIPKDKIILLDLNYTLISNSWKIRHDRLPQKIYNRLILTLALTIPYLDFVFPCTLIYMNGLKASPTLTPLPLM